ncbi:frizzled-6 isoform X1 [Pelobates cultripes]|uniref:Frizzled-6 n=1 Tax=Pelobates cultripes TaxID=61616 RepID=A0AAD1S3N1_PELCU|nr:frizzled-6 isoform X1 [Pelobates cultripes]
MSYVLALKVNVIRMTVCSWIILFGTLLLPNVENHSLFTCEPITVPRCIGMTYNMTFFPNMMEHYDQDIAASKMEPFLPLLNLHCSPEVHAFLCQAFVPACTEPKNVAMPCRSLCKTVYSDCKQMIDTFDITWPDELECDRLDECDTTDSISTGENLDLGTPKPPEKIHRDYGFWCPRHLKTSQGTGYQFLGVNHCAPPCPNMYFEKADLDFAKNFIGIISIICLCATLFTFLTFLIDVKRFRYPERPIIFYSVCYSIVSLMYFIGFLMGNSISCSEADENFAEGDTVVLGSQNKACTVIFMLLYFCTMAGTIWWVMLTITWYLAAGQKWSCEAIEQKSMWFHTVAWGLPGVLTVVLLAMNKVEGDNISGVCFVGLYDKSVSTYFVLIPLSLCVFIGLSLLLAGIISLNNVRQVIQHDERNQEKLKKFMIRIGVFSGTYLVPLVILLGCYGYEQLSRTNWEMTWVADHCQEYHIPCPLHLKNLSRPNFALFLTKYVMTLIVGISAIFWVGSKKTCSEWSNFFHRSKKQDPVSESRRVLQESCEFFLKHNAKEKHKRRHPKSSSHKLKVISKSMGTSTGAKANHGISAVAITSHDFLGQNSTVDIRSTSDLSPKIEQDHGNVPVKGREDNKGEITTQTLLEVPMQPADCNNKLGSRKGNSLSGSVHNMIEESLYPLKDFTETSPNSERLSHQNVGQPDNLGHPISNKEKEMMNLMQSS